MSIERPIVRPRVVSLDERRKRGTKPLLEVIRTESCLCSFHIVEKTRTVTCERCGRTWDAFDALLYMARDFSRYEYNRNTLKREADRAEEEVLRLKKELQSLRRKLRDTKRTTCSAVTEGCEPAPKTVR